MSTNLWFLTPLQAFVTLGAAANFGGSVLQTPLIFPSILHTKVPIQYSAQQIKALLNDSEKFFPPLNMLCTLGNIVVAVTAYRNRNTSPLAAAKLPYAIAGAVLNIATTAWALNIMVPMNRKMAQEAVALDGNPNNETSAKNLRNISTKWKRNNLVRATIMISASIVSVIGLLQDGSVLRI